MRNGWYGVVQTQSTVSWLFLGSLIFLQVETICPHDVHELRLRKSENNNPIVGRLVSGGFAAIWLSVHFSNPILRHFLRSTFKNRIVEHLHYVARQHTGVFFFIFVFPVVNLQVEAPAVLLLLAKINVIDTS